MTYHKEPHFFALDLPGRRDVTDMDDYRRLFMRDKPWQLCGEASVFYLYSAQAIPALMNHNPKAKVIAFLRNPTDVFVSLHNQHYNCLNEDQLDPQLAWRLQESRANGRSVPQTCVEPKLLQYRDICALGSQIERMFSIVPEDQRLVVLFDDLQRAPQDCLTRVCEFLGIEIPNSFRIAHLNSFQTLRTSTVPRAVRLIRSSRNFSRVRTRIKPIFNMLGLEPLQWILKANLKGTPKPILRPDFHGEIVATFSEEVIKLERLLGRPLDHWKTNAERETVEKATALR